jgi:hypothetical protein
MTVIHKPAFHRIRSRRLEGYYYPPNWLLKDLTLRTIVNIIDYIDGRTFGVSQLMQATPRPGYHFELGFPPNYE